jgi:hypothetical protein
MGQVVGQLCHRCRKRISTILAGDFCPGCGSAVHFTCSRPGTTPGACARCGSESSVVLAPDYSVGGEADAPQRPRPEADSRSAAVEWSGDLRLEDPVRNFGRLLRIIRLTLTLIPLLALCVAVGGCVLMKQEAEKMQSVSSPDVHRAIWGEEPDTAATRAWADYEAAWNRARAWDGYAFAATVAVLTSPGVWLFVALYTAFMPRREADAFYLRSFRHDPESWPVRVAIQEALGPRFRLSGIRDPRRRKVRLIDYLNPVFLAMRYCTPKFMDLEAGDDWAGRLWNSMRNGRCVFLDVTDLTPFVAEELGLSHACIGADRILLVGDQARDEAGWRAAVAEHLPAGAADSIRVAVWTGPAGRREFMNRVREFREQLPAERLVPAPPPDAHRAYVRRPWLATRTGQFVVSFIALQVVLTIAAYFYDFASRGYGVVLALGVGNGCLAFWNWAIYIRDVGVRYERRKAIIGLAAWVGLLVFSVWMLVRYDLWQFFLHGRAALR